ncbi:MAG: hypothetical protein P5702_23425, partial [Limnospira sp. PMC 1291.21]|nr:hypothetical protein [Limnospira sp. PMC 1281.21]MDT9308203.1 hypothetical protein [Limnospira sp. PMC 1291.21]
KTSSALVVMGVVLGGVLILHFSRSPLRDTSHSDCAIACFEKPGFFKKPGFLNSGAADNGCLGKVGRVYIAAGEEEYRLLNPPLQEYVTPGWLGKAIAHSVVRASCLYS